MKAEERERQRRREGAGEWKSGEVEEEKKEEAKGNLARGFGNFITVYSDLLWFIPTGYPIPAIIIITSPTGHDWVLLEGKKGDDCGGFKCTFIVFRRTVHGISKLK